MIVHLLGNATADGTAQAVADILAGEPSAPCVARSGEVVAIASGRDATRPTVEVWQAPPAGDPRDPGPGPGRAVFIARQYKCGAARPPLGLVRAFVEDGTAPESARAAVARLVGAPLDVVEEVASGR